MKILYISYVKPGSGGSVHTSQFVQAAKKLDMDLIVYPSLEPVLSGAGEKAEKRAQKFREFRALGAMFARNLMPEYRLIKKIQPDAIVLRAGRYLSSLAIAKFMKIPIVLEINGPVLEQKFLPKDQRLRWLSFWQLVEKKMLLDLPDHVTVVSEILRQYYIGRGIAPEKISCAPNGVDTQIFRPDLGINIKKSLGLTGKIVVGFSGNFSFWHGLPGLVKAMEKILKKNKDTALLLIGKPNIGFKMPGLPKQRVVTTGYVAHENMPQYLDAVDVFVAPYPKMELFYFSPLKIFEAMAMGKTVVASGQGQINELVKDGETGLLYEPGDKLGLEQKLMQACSCKKLRQRLGQNARKKILENYTWEINARKVMDACKKAKKK